MSRGSVAERLFATLQDLPRPVLTALAMLFLGMVGAADYVTGPDISLTLLYMLPVIVVAWYAGLGAGMATALVAALLWFGADLLAGYPQTRQQAYLWNGGLHLASLAIVAYLLAVFRQEADHHGGARIDEQTGAASRGYFYDLVTMEMNRCRRYKRPFTVLYVDVDDFGLLVEQQGAAVGEQALAIMTESLRKNTRSADMVARIGADEFGVLLPETEHEPSVVVTHKLQRVVTEALHEQGIELTFSMCAITYERAPRTLDEIIRLSDDLMYFIKRSGKNMIKHEVYRLSTAALR